MNESSNVSVLVRETSPSEFPIAAKIEYGRGLIFHFIYVGTDVCGRKEQQFESCFRY